MTIEATVKSLDESTSKVVKDFMLGVDTVSVLFTKRNTIVAAKGVHKTIVKEVVHLLPESLALESYTRTPTKVNYDSTLKALDVLTAKETGKLIECVMIPFIDDLGAQLYNTPLEKIVFDPELPSHRVYNWRDMDIASEILNTLGGVITLDDKCPYLELLTLKDETLGRIIGHTKGMINSFSGKNHHWNYVTNCITHAFPVTLKATGIEINKLPNVLSISRYFDTYEGLSADAERYDERTVNFKEVVKTVNLINKRELTVLVIALEELKHTLLQVKERSDISQTVETLGLLRSVLTTLVFVSSIVAERTYVSDKLVSTLNELKGIKS